MRNISPFRNPLCVALDVDTIEQVEVLDSQLSDLVGGFKIGPRLLLRYGGELVRRLSAKTPVFVDCKFFDIPSTMEASIRSCFEMGASVVTVHALAGEEALQKMAHLEKELSRQRPFKILAVTILTSWSVRSVPANFQTFPISQHVLSLSELVKHCGLSGIVCSAEEINLIKNLDLFMLTPGIRMPGQSDGDQKRVVGPAEAIRRGSSVLVVGRPIIEDPRPREAASLFLQEIEKN